MYGMVSPPMGGGERGNNKIILKGTGERSGFTTGEAIRFFDDGEMDTQWILIKKRPDDADSSINCK